MASPTPKRPLVAVVALALLAGCGPFGYLSKVAKDASRAVAEAERAEAPKYAPYEYWGAVTYLEQAKILMAYSEYERSFDYGGRAKQLAEEAKSKAERRESGRMKEAVPTTPAAAPATPAKDAPAAEAEGKASVGGGTGGDR